MFRDNASTAPDATDAAPSRGFAPAVGSRDSDIVAACSFPIPTWASYLAVGEMGGWHLRRCGSTGWHGVGATATWSRAWRGTGARTGESRTGEERRGEVKLTQVLPDEGR